MQLIGMMYFKLAAFLGILIAANVDGISDFRTPIDKSATHTLVWRPPLQGIKNNSDSDSPKTQLGHSADDDKKYRSSTMSQAMKKLLDVLDLQVPIEGNAGFTAKRKTKKPPKYMSDLYRAVADVNGITKDSGLLNVDTVRSIPNKGLPGSNVCKFDLSAMKDNEDIVDAELHVFQSQRSFRKLQETNRLHPHHRTTMHISSHVIRIYQLMSNLNSTSTEKTLITARRISLHHSGWHVFPILSTVKSWIESQATKFVLLTETITSTGENIKVSERDSLQPLLIIFTNYTGRANTISVTDNSVLPTAEIDKQELNHRSVSKHIRNKRSTNTQQQPHRSNTRNNLMNGRSRYRGNPSVFDNPYTTYLQPNEQPVMSPKVIYGIRRHTPERAASNQNVQQNSGYGYKDAENTNDNMQYQRPARSPSFSFLGDSAKTLRNCRRYPLYVNFEDMGWAGWIIHPSGYNAYHCKGNCPFPLSAQLNPTNHATVQSIMHTLGLGDQPVEMPCCAPSKLYDINLLYFDQNDYVVLRRYKGMVAASCACR